MKKLLTFIASLFALVTLVACQTTSSTNASDENQITVTLTVAFSDSKTETKTVTVDKDETVMDILEDNYDVEEEGGMVTAIDGVSQDTATNTYWMYDINEDLAPKGAEEMTVSDGDTIRFYLEAFN